MKIRDVMTSPARACSASDSLNQAAQAMWDGDLGCLPVIDADQAVVGIITDRDLAMAAHLRGAPLWSVPVGEAMAKVVYMVQATDSVREAAKLMSKHQLRRVPVVDRDGKLCGIVTLGALACAAAAKRKKSFGLKDVATILAAVSSPRPPTPTEPLVVEVTRESVEVAKDVIQPAPRKTRKAAAKGAPAKNAAAKNPATKGKSKSAR